MDLLATILACSLYFDDDLVRAIAESNSHANPYFVTDVGIELTAIIPPDPRTVDDALVRVHDIAAKGGRPALGWMDLPPAWIASFGRSNRDALDGCTNIAIGSAMLSQFDYECREVRATGPGDARRRACVIRKYADAIGMPDFVTITDLELRFQRPVPLAEHVMDTPILFEGATPRTWGADRILVPVDGPR
jgi:hypothetical protein